MSIVDALAAITTQPPSVVGSMDVYFPTASVTAVPRSLASAISPAISGALLMTAFSGLPLVVCGTLKIAYDLGLLYFFRHIKPPEEKA